MCEVASVLLSLAAVVAVVGVVGVTIYWLRGVRTNSWDEKPNRGAESFFPPVGSRIPIPPPRPWPDLVADPAAEIVLPTTDEEWQAIVKRFADECAELDDVGNEPMVPAHVPRDINHDSQDTDKQ
jgi:hypothetical protein